MRLAVDSGGTFSDVVVEEGNGRHELAAELIEVTPLERAEATGGRRVSDPVRIDCGINDGGAAVYLRDPGGYDIGLFQQPA
jgi:hypothetical protein